MTWRFHFPLRNYDFKLTVHMSVCENIFFKTDWKSVSIFGMLRNMKIQIV